MHADELQEIAREEQDSLDVFEHHIIVCSGTGCQSLQSEQLREQLETEVKNRGLERWCAISRGGCRGLCAEGPLVSVEPQSRLYQNVTPADAGAIVESLDSKPIKRLRCDTTMPFFTRQKKVVLEH